MRRGDTDVTTQTSAQARNGDIEETDGSAQRRTTSRQMQIAGRAKNEFSLTGEIRSFESDGRCREQHGRRARGDALAKEGDHAALVGIGIPGGGSVRMAVIVAAGVQVGVELGTDGEDRQ